MLRFFCQPHYLTGALGVFAIIYGIVLLVRAFQFRALLKA